jgi:hypothetical protein
MKEAIEKINIQLEKCPLLAIDLEYAHSTKSVDPG